MRYFFLIILLFFPTASFAAEFQLEQQLSSIRAGDTFTVTLSLRTDADSINAIEGTIHFSPILSLADIRLQGSLVPLWISSPTEKEKGVVSFAGVLPGGYQGEGKIFTLVFKAAKKGDAHLSFGSDTGAYQNDGKGTAAKLSLPELSFSIGTPSGTPRTVNLEEDVSPPESFTPVVSSGELFGLTGSVLVFTTQDKNSGIVRYDIARSYYKRANENSLSWSMTASPYLLIPGDSTQYLYVRAVDRAGNTRMEVVPPQEFSVIAFMLAWWWILLLVAMAGLVVLFVRFQKQ